MSDKASEKELNALHATVARVLREQLEGEDGEEKAINLASPQMVAQAIKFLKDNNITATPEIGDDLGDLAEILSKKQKKGSAQLRAIPAKKAAGEE